MASTTEEKKFNHSVKVPQLYKVSARVLDAVENKKQSLKGAIFSAKHPRTNALQSLVMKALQNSEALDYMIRKSKMMEEEPRFATQLPLAKVLIAELTFGSKKLTGESKPIQTIMKYQAKFEKAHRKFLKKPQNQQIADAADETLILKPRFVRVNTVMTTVEDVVNFLLQEGWNQVEPCSSDKLEEYDFYKDDFLETLLVFAPKTTFHRHPLYLNGSLVLQDKASCLAAMALKPRLGRGVLDACAAPGMKTTFLAALAGKDSTIYAVEKSNQRCQTLRETLSAYGCDFVQVVNKDFTELDPAEHVNVEYILVDPSCSGSGMYNRFEVSKHTKSDPDRLANLSFYQKKVLCHAMKFPSVKRIVYSTCSIHSEENEDVIHGSLEFADNHRRFRLKKALPAWKHRCVNSNYEWAEMCVKCDYENDGTDGFFIAVLERTSKGK